MRAMRAASATDSLSEKLRLIWSKRGLRRKERCCWRTNSHLDPEADNSKAEAWAASDESSKSEWHTYSYRMVAQASLAASADGQWREFLLGLLGEGECLVDDIRVVQLPANNPVSLLSNGDFENGQTEWRVLGTHAASRVITRAEV